MIFRKSSGHKFLILRVGPLTYTRSHDFRILWLNDGAKNVRALVELTETFKRMGRAKRFVRGCFPFFMGVGLRCCDNYGRVTRWYPVFAWNQWHLDRLMASWSGAGDGEVWSECNPFRWLKWKFQGSAE